MINFLSTHETWHLYARGYREAADSIVGLVDEGLPSHPPVDMIVYPVAFMYRHSVELRLKEIILSCGQLLLQRDKYRQTHRLTDLWQQALDLIPLVYDDIGHEETDEDKEIIERVQKSISKIDDLDEAATAFRYPVTTKDLPSLHGRKHLHLGELASFYGELLDALESLSAWLGELTQLKYEWLSEMQDHLDDLNQDNLGGVPS